MNEPVLEVINLSKKFGTLQAVNNISFEVPKGKVIGFLGPNGAGKSTTINILIGVLLPDSGEINYFGKNFAANREYCLSRINFTSSFNELQGRISVWENLLVFSHLYGVKNSKSKISELLDYFEISNLKNTRFWNLSTGQRTRVNIAKSLINDPDLILMDEPTASLDPDIADKTLSLIEKLRKSRELSILYTSHDMAEVTRICDEVIFLDNGKIVAHDTPESLIKRIPGVRLTVRFDDSDKPLVVDTTEPEIPFLLAKAADKRKVLDIEIKKPTLEDVFLDIARKQKNVISKN